MQTLEKQQRLWAVCAIILGTALCGAIVWRFENTDPMWSIISFVLVYDANAAAARKAGLSRLTLTIFGSALALGLIFAFGLHRWLLPVGLGISAMICCLFLRTVGNWRIVLVTVALILGSSLLQPDAEKTIALVRSAEVCLGSGVAILFSWGTARLLSRNCEE